VITVAIAAFCGSWSKAHAQSPESDEAPAHPKATPAPTTEPVKYFLPDMPQWAQYNNSWFSFKVGIAALYDYTGFDQDPPSIAQVGKVENGWNVRDARLIFRGSVGKEYKMSYVFAAAYKGFDANPARLWDIVDAYLIFPLGSKRTTVSIGKMKQSFAYEMVGDAGNLPQQERLLSPFFVSRDLGVKVNHYLKNQRMTFAAGVYDGAWLRDNTSQHAGVDFSARVTGLAWDEHKDNRFLHLAVAYRYVGADDGQLRYKGRPESNVGPNYVDTGNFEADHANHLGFEAFLNVKNISLLGEYNHAWVSSAVNGNPQFFGAYVTGSWVITGETRPYDRTVGYARRVIPRHRYGAFEAVARFGHVDLDDGLIRGGKFNKSYLGLNWWASRQWKFGIGWGHTWLDRAGLDGNTDSVQFRTQWIY
jgi:phosphate-selective porin OprO/OprP